MTNERFLIEGSEIGTQEIMTNSVNTMMIKLCAVNDRNEEEKEEKQRFT